MPDTSFLPALIGGILIGLGSLLAVLATGRPLGISGVVSRILGGDRGEVSWRLVFLGGLVGGAMLATALFSEIVDFRPQPSLTVMAVAGLLVGFGTRVGGGCTSGHGVCGLSLGSKSGLVATVVFMAVGMVTVYVMRHVLGGAAS